MFDPNLRLRRYSLSENAVAMGQAFRMFDEVTIAPTSTALWSVVVPQGNECGVLFERMISCDQPNVKYEVFLAATGVTYGQSITIRNMNALSSKTSGVQFRRLTAGTVQGERSDIDLIRGVNSASGTAHAGSGETARFGDIRVFPPGIEVFIRVTNPNADPAEFLAYLKFFKAPVALFAD